MHTSQHACQHLLEDSDIWRERFDLSAAVVRRQSGESCRNYGHGDGHDHGHSHVYLAKIRYLVKKILDFKIKAICMADDNRSDAADRAAHGWAVEAVTQESSLGVELIGTNFAGPGQNLVQVQYVALPLLHVRVLYLK